MRSQKTVIKDAAVNNKLCERCDAGNFAKNTINNLDVCKKCFGILDRVVNGAPKRCCRCKTYKPLSEYTKDKQTADGLSARCIACKRVEKANYYQNNAAIIKYKAKSWRLKNPTRRLEYERFSRYKLTAQDIQKLLEQQNNACKICNKQFNENLKPKVDHDHACCHSSMTCGKCIRGLLCINCNLAIGLLEDNVFYMESAINYVKMGVSEYYTRN